MGSQRLLLSSQILSKSPKGRRGAEDVKDEGNVNLSISHHIIPQMRRLRPSTVQTLKLPDPRGKYSVMQIRAAKFLSRSQGFDTFHNKSLRAEFLPFPLSKPSKGQDQVGRGATVLTLPFPPHMPAETLPGRKAGLSCSRQSCPGPGTWHLAGTQ